MCKCCPVTGCRIDSPKSVVANIGRAFFGIALALVGTSHFQGLSGFVPMVNEGLGPITFLGTIWGYVLPLLMIVGGLALVWKKTLLIGAWASTLALASIPAGLLLKPVLAGNPEALGTAMEFSSNALLWLIVLLLTVKFSSSGCASACGCGATGAAGAACGSGCGCGCGEKKM